MQNDINEEREEPPSIVNISKAESKNQISMKDQTNLGEIICEINKMDSKSGVSSSIPSSKPSTKRLSYDIDLESLRKWKENYAYFH